MVAGRRFRVLEAVAVRSSLRNQCSCVSGRRSELHEYLLTGSGLVACITGHFLVVEVSVVGSLNQSSADLRPVRLLTSGSCSWKTEWQSRVGGMRNMTMAERLLLL